MPPLDGALVSAPSDCAAHADDFGHLVHKAPVAILYPASIEDVAKAVTFARQSRIRVAARGNGHTAFGQSQADAGLVIDLKSLCTIHEITSDRAVVDAGVLWRDLLIASLEIGRTPPVLTDFIGLTVGGTLSVGGVSGSSYLAGAQVDSVEEMIVVAGTGEIVTCSPTQNTALFQAVLAGLGLSAIVVRVTLRLVPAREMARTHRLFYSDVPTMLADMRALVATARFDHLRGNAAPGESGWAYFLEGTSYFNPEDGAGLPPDPFAGLQGAPESATIEDKSYFDFCDAVYQIVELLKLFGLFDLPHPWLDLFVPGSSIDAFATGAIEALPVAELMPGSLVLFYPFRRSVLGCPMLRVPDEEVFFLFDILQTSAPTEIAKAKALSRNRALYEHNRSLGGAEYTISAVPMSPCDWHAHFGPVWGDLIAAKRRWDPNNVLGAGLTVFG